MNREVIERLIDNLENKPIKHSQGSWLRNGKDIFVVSPEDRWSCATTGCAAGFIFLTEAPAGYVLDVISERIFRSEEDYATFQNKFNEYVRTRCSYGDIPFELGTKISRWAANQMDIDYEQAYDLFYDFGDTNHIIDRLKELLNEDSNG